MNTRPLAAETFPYLSSALLDRLAISTVDMVDEVERQIAGQRRGEVWCAPKAVVLPGDDRYIMATLGVSSAPPVLATKSLVVNPRNGARGLPTLNSLITLLDAETGVPLALVDGNWVTEKRTAALSAVAARRMARSDAASIAFIGCGVQARGHLEAFADLFPLSEVRAFGRGAANRDALCAMARSRGMNAIACDTAMAAIEGADMVVTSVTLVPRPEPFLDANWLKAGSFTVMTDQALPWLPETMTRFDRIIVDDLEQEKNMARPMIDPARAAGDLTGLVCGDFAGREGPGETTTFLFRGLAVGDLAVAALVYERAREVGAVGG